MSINSIANDVARAGKLKGSLNNPLSKLGRNLYSTAKVVAATGQICECGVFWDTEDTLREQRLHRSGACMPKKGRKK